MTSFEDIHQGNSKHVPGIDNTRRGRRGSAAVVATEMATSSAATNSQQLYTSPSIEQK